MRKLHLDFETFCVLDLKKVGVSRYTRDPSFTPTVLAWAFDDDPVQSIKWPHTLMLPAEILEHIKNGGEIDAWNASFEAAVLTNFYGRPVSVRQINCTMQRSLYSGYPGALGDAARVLNTGVQKDLTASRLMLQMARPRSLNPLVTWHETDAAKLQQLEQYCQKDVGAERGVSKLIPELSKDERLVSELDRRANERGVMIDRDLVQRMIVVAAVATQKLDARCGILTNQSVTSPGTQTAKLTQWLATKLPNVPDISKDTIATLLKDPAVTDATTIEVLQIRQEVAKSSVKKLQTMERAADVADDRIRGAIAYYGANRTGRWAGRLIQPQNYPRPTGYPGLLIDAILKGFFVEDIEVIHGPALSAIAGALRGCIIPAKGHKLISVDLAQIEARVIAWLAGQNDVLEVFARGEDIYTYAQQRQGLPTRQGGKVVTLGLGFQMGAERFQETAKGYGLELSMADCVTIVEAWRKLNSKIVAFWWTMHRGIESLLLNYQTPRVDFVQLGPHLKASLRIDKLGRPLMCIHLPSGRALFYRHCHLDMAGEITYEGVDQITKKWGLIRTYGGKLAENVTQAVARDILAQSLLDVEHETQGLAPLVLSVHDEGVFEAEESIATGMMLRIKGIFERPKSWTAGLPIGSDAKVLSRYGK